MQPSLKNKESDSFNELVISEGITIPVIEIENERYITLSSIDKIHQRPESTARQAFNRNKSRFIEGKHFIKMDAKDLKAYVRHTRFEMDISKYSSESFVLLSESGYLKVTKVFDDDLSWKIQDVLIDSYFRAKQLETINNQQSPKQPLNR